MSRRLVTNAEITKLINHRLKEGKKLDGDCRDVEVDRVQPFVQPDQTGCNWDIGDWVRCPVACIEVLRLIVDDLRVQYNLIDN